MKARMSHLRFYLIAALSGILLSCAASIPPPGPIDSESSGLCIALKMREMLGPIPTSTKTPEVVLFMRLEEHESPGAVTEKEILFPSTFIDGEYAYLLNVTAGQYVAVAAIYGKDAEPIQIPVVSANVGSNTTIGYSLNLGGGEVIYRNYFSRDLIAASLTEVGPASFAFMGRYVADQSIRFGKADDCQKHILHLLEGEDADREGFFEDIFSNDWARRLSPHEVKRDREATIDFCKKARKHLEGTPWVTMIDRLKARQ
jgi:hypothetical protein